MKPYALLFVAILITAFAWPPNVDGEPQKDPTQLILGKWIVVHSTYTPFEHVSYCDSLTEDAVFEFRKDRTLLVYASPGDTNCNQSQSYAIDERRIEMLEYDMLWNYDILKLSNDSLKFRINRIPNSFWTTQGLSDSAMYARMMELRDEGIVVTLAKLRSREVDRVPRF
ncbi:MAG: hypothetical protein HWD92_03750 [Flavobacteriia bacterium]|nr:hypothetical protein [Flavobacteriia bacterium]